MVDVPREMYLRTIFKNSLSILEVIIEEFRYILFGTASKLKWVKDRRIVFILSGSIDESSRQKILHLKREGWILVGVNFTCRDYDCDAVLITNRKHFINFFKTTKLPNMKFLIGEHIPLKYRIWYQPRNSTVIRYINRYDNKPSQLMLDNGKLTSSFRSSGPLGIALFLAYKANFVLCFGFTGYNWDSLDNPESKYRARLNRENREQLSLIYSLCEGRFGLAGDTIFNEWSSVGV